MKLTPHCAADSKLPTASMADVAFLLIIFFMVTMSFEKDLAQVQLPSTEIRKEVPRQAAIVSLSENGELRAGNGDEMSQVIDSEDLLTFASNLVGEHPERAVLIKADSEVVFQRVDEVLDAMKQARVKMIFLLSEPKTSS